MATRYAKLATIAKPELPYTAPPGVPLTPITAQATLLLSASPDTGWAILPTVPRRHYHQPDRRNVRLHRRPHRQGGRGRPGEQAVRPSPGSAGAEPDRRPHR